jgi:hypothetical protein
MVPFMYLAIVALLLSAYVHGHSFPSRGFLKAYAAPSNGLVQMRALGPVCSNYFQVCVRLTGADHEKQENQQLPSK